ncbi:MAG: SagB/ThcOx family dehydrogenase [Candidatus Zixiibacteriota bacterium]
MLSIIRVIFVIAFFLIFTAYAGEDENMSIGEQFHYQTSFGDSGFKGKNINYGSELPLYKKYENTPVVYLPSLDTGTISVEKAIDSRKSVRSFTEMPLNIRQIARILQSADGITHTQSGYEMRTAPSGGALYPVDIYLAAFEVDDLKPGLYHFQVSDNSLELVKEGNFREQLYSASHEQDVVNLGRASIIMTARFDRSTRKYADRGYRYTYMEAGAICQNIYLQATALGLGTTAVGAFNDDALNKMLEIDGKEEAALLIMPIGHPH